jgi:hypothetical protein
MTADNTRYVSPSSWPTQTHVFRDETDALVIEQRDADGDVVEVVIPADDLMPFIDHICDLANIPSNGPELTEDEVREYAATLRKKGFTPDQLEDWLSKFDKKIWQFPETVRPRSAQAERQRRYREREKAKRQASSATSKGDDALTSPRGRGTLGHENHPAPRPPLLSPSEREDRPPLPKATERRALTRKAG